MLNRCVVYNDSGLTKKADPRHAELAKTSTGVRNQRAVQMNVVTDESRHKRIPPGVPVSVISSLLGARVPADVPGCLATRRSTSGSAAMRGWQPVKKWSSTQNAVTLSSAEAELCGIVKGTTEAPGTQSVGRDLGSSRRNLAVGKLWVQEGPRRGDFRLFFQSPR